MYTKNSAIPFNPAMKSLMSHLAWQGRGTNKDGNFENNGDEKTDR